MRCGRRLKLAAGALPQERSAMQTGRALYQLPAWRTTQRLSPSLAIWQAGRYPLRLGKLSQIDWPNVNQFTSPKRGAALTITAVIRSGLVPVTLCSKASGAVDGHRYFQIDRTTRLAGSLFPIRRSAGTLHQSAAPRASRAALPGAVPFLLPAWFLQVRLQRAATLSTVFIVSINS